MKIKLISNVFIIILFSVLNNVNAQKYHSLMLDGIDDYVTVGTVNEYNITNNISIEAWIKISSFQNFPIWNRIIDNMDFVNSEGYNLVLRQNVIRFEFCNLKGVKSHVETKTLLNDDTWHYIVATFDSTQMRIYVDGKQDNYLIVTPRSIRPSRNQLAFGNNNDGNGWLPLKGSIDEVRIWNRVLKPKEIKNMMEENFNIYPSSLIGYWSFDKCKDNNVPDYSGLSNNGTMKNGALLSDDVPITRNYHSAIIKKRKSN